MLTQRLKRGLAWLLTALLVLAAVAGCGSQTVSSQSQTSPAARGQEASSQSQTSPAARGQETPSQSQTSPVARAEEASAVRDQEQTPGGYTESADENQKQETLPAARGQETTSQSQTSPAAQSQETPSQSQTSPAARTEEASAVRDQEQTPGGYTESADENQKQETLPDAQEDGQDALSIEEDGSYTTREEVALYLHTYGHLPDNYITKKDAENLGWDNKKGNLWEVAPGKSIGGSHFGNYEKQLPEKKGRKYYECDINYQGKYRGAERIIYSDEGLVFYTGDHYKTFEQLYP